MTTASSYAISASLALVNLPKLSLLLPSIWIDALGQILSVLSTYSQFVIFLLYFFGIISTTRQSCRNGKFRLDLGCFAWIAVKSYAMAASFAVPNIPMCCCLPLILICAWNLSPCLCTPLYPVVFLDESFFFIGLYFLGT